MASVGNNMKVLEKIKNRATIWSRNFTPVKIYEENKNIKSKSTCTTMFITALFNRAKICKETKCPTTEE